MTKISVVIPTYNREKFVMEAVQSVLGQSIQDIEVLVVDDGSTDHTRQIFEGANLSNSVRYLWKNNGGEASARNFGIRHARGQYIAFLDSDDLLVNDGLGKQFDILLTHPDLGLVHADFEKILESGQKLGRRNTSWFQGYIYPQILCHWNSLMAVDTVMVPAYVFTEVGYFNESLKTGTDLDMWRRLARKYKFFHIPEILAQVRVHRGNISKNRVGEADAFRHIIDIAVQDDKNLSDDFCKYALANMYSTTGFNLLTDYGKSEMPEARKRFAKAVGLYPSQSKSYFGWLLTMMPFPLRKNLGKIWRKIKYPVQGK